MNKIQLLRYLVKKSKHNNEYHIAISRADAKCILSDSDELQEQLESCKRGSETLAKRVEELELHSKYMEKDKKFYQKSAYDLEEELNKAKDDEISWKRAFEIINNQNQRYRDALEFYADETNYSTQQGKRARITKDYGQKARQTLEDDHL